MYGLLVTDSGSREKAKRIIQKFTRNAEVKEGHSVLFLYSRWPKWREACMNCDGTQCPLAVDYKALGECPRDKVIDDVMLGLHALQYVHVKAKLVFPAP